MDFLADPGDSAEKPFKDEEIDIITSFLRESKMVLL
jgi:hypothetical protein